MRHDLISSCVLLVVAASFVGCDQAPQSLPTAPATSAAPVIDATAIKLTEIDAGGFEKAVAAHQGKVVLVDFWATWCNPCVKAFPHTVALSRKFADKNFVTISVSLDESDSGEDVKAFLAQQQAMFEHCHYVGQEDAFEVFSLKEGIPELRLYDQTGKLVGKWNSVAEADLEAKIAELLQ